MRGAAKSCAATSLFVLPVATSSAMRPLGRRQPVAGSRTAADPRQLDDDAVAEAWEQGRMLTVDEAVAFALDPS